MSKYKDWDDYILRLLKTDSRQAIGLLFMKYHSLLLKIVAQVIRDEDTANDIVQELFLYLWYHRKNLILRKPLRNYLAKSAVNRALNYLRNEKKRNLVVLGDPEDYRDILQVLPHETLPDVTEVRRRIRMAISRLPQREKVPYLLHRRHTMSYKEIAAYLGVSEKTVQKRISLALRLLRKCLAPLLKSIVVLISVKMY